MTATLVVNAGSSSLKLARIEGATRATARIEGIGGVGPPDHVAALRLALDGLGGPLPSRAVHRIVHGGDRDAPVRVTPAVMAELDVTAALAPLHVPPALAVIRALAAAAPGMAQVAVFDTAFHATLPPEERDYALPEAERARGLCRYGFHGISYAGLVEALREGGRLPARLLALHLGAGASLCAIRDGRSVATTMGYSPVSGLPMGTRAGDVDPMAVLDLARRHGIDGAADMLNRRSGLMALGGAADLRELRGAGAQAALDHFAHHAARQSGAMVAAMGGLDALAFTGGIGENDALMRHAILSRLAWTGLVPDGAGGTEPSSPIPSHVVPADEEATMVRMAEGLLP